MSSASAASWPALRMPSKASGPCSLILPSRSGARVTSTFDICGSLSVPEVGSPRKCSEICPPRNARLGPCDFGNDALRLSGPVVLLDAAGELQGLVEVGNVVVGEVGDLLELDGVELTQ